MKFSAILLITLFIFAACNTNNKNKQDKISKTDTLSVTLKVNGMTCDHCEMAIEKSIKTLPGIVHAKADHTDSTTTVQFIDSKSDIIEIKAAIIKKGYSPE